VRAGFEVWLSLTSDGYVRPRAAAGEPAAFGIEDEHGAALAVGDGDPRPILAFGDGEAAAGRLVRAYRAWARERPSLDRLRVDAHPTGEAPAGPGRVVRRPRYTFVVSGS
jgi:hypothetical protein